MIEWKVYGSEDSKQRHAVADICGMELTISLDRSWDEKKHWRFKGSDLKAITLEDAQEEALLLTRSLCVLVARRIDREFSV
jgi:hypothetical protein